MFGRSKLEMNTRAAPSSRRDTISARVCSSAVAVSATRGTPGKRRASTDSWMYSGRKSWPHCETQCASSIANRLKATDSEQLQAALRQQPLGRQVQQVQLPGPHQPLDALRLLPVQGGVQRLGAHPRLLQRRHLVLHERDQGRDHHAMPGRTSAGIW